MNASKLVACVLTMLAMTATAAQAQWSTVALKIFYNSGNVGIGTNDPAHKLEVRSNAGTRAISGLSSAASGVTHGVYGQSNSTVGRGVYGLANSVTGKNYGVYAKTNSPVGYGVYSVGARNYFEGRVGIGDDTPVAALTVGADDKFQVNGNTGAVKFTDDRAGITFPATEAPNSAMINLFATGTENDVRMVITHSPKYQDWGLQYDDSPDHFNFIAEGFLVMRVDLGNGRVGIARAPATNALEVEGNASKTTATAWLANSDARIKSNIETISNALETLERVRLVTFNYTDDYRTQHPSIKDRAYMNIIAQEFAQVFPEYVQPSGETFPNGQPVLQADTYPLTIYSAAAIQELHQIVRERDVQIASQQQVIESQQDQIDDLATRVARLEKALGSSKPSR